MGTGSVAPGDGCYSLCYSNSAKMVLDISGGDHLSSVVMTLLTDQLAELETFPALEELDEHEPQVDEKCPQCHQPFSAWACSYAHGRARVERGLRFDGRPA